MDCNATTYEQLIALMTGELPFWRAWRLRRHLAHCADCRAAFADTQALWKAARLTGEKTVEEDIKERLYASLLTTLREETDTMLESRNPALPRRPKRVLYATNMLIALVLITPVVASVLYVKSRQAASVSHEEAERSMIGADWQQRGLMTQQDYVKLRQMMDGVRATGTISDSDLGWALKVMQQSSSSIVHARVLGMFTLLQQIAPSQKQKLQDAIRPLLTSEDKLDSAYANRVQAVLDKHGVRDLVQ